MDRHPRQKTDPRAIETVGKLVRSLSELSTADADALPTVEQIARQAGVNRSSFYAHFDDLEGLLSWWLEEQLRPVFARDVELRTDHARSGRDVGRVSLGEVIELLGGLRGPLTTMFRHSPTSRHRFAERFTEFMGPNFEAVGSRRGWTRLQAGAASRFYGAGIAAVLVAWTLGELDGDDAELLDRLLELVPEDLRTADA
jgi:AcrR family transcriptional regulator